MAKTFNLYQKHPEGSDCTAPYMLAVIGTPTVSEVITDIKSRREHGSIVVYGEGRKSVGHIDYNGNQILSGNIDPEFKYHIVTGGSSVGGWGRMDYTLHIN